MLQHYLFVEKVKLTFIFLISFFKKTNRRTYIIWHFLMLCKKIQKKVQKHCLSVCLLFLSKTSLVQTNWYYIITLLKVRVFQLGSNVRQSPKPMSHAEIWKSCILKINWDLRSDKFKNQRTELAITLITDITLFECLICWPSTKYVNHICNRQTLFKTKLICKQI